ncbi:MAG TPA: BamA/TamA family outer membrane protein [Anaeromyxobacteraceae bacterium]|nr:BamA/TamA family outer membrane protein [Anaeromyxobacteraceae bacterium]
MLLSLLARPAAAGEPRRVEAIEVVGNHRTATAFILKELGVRPGDAYDGGADVLAQRLLNLRLFTSARVVAQPASEDTVTLEVAVEERWTLLPIPMFTSSGNDTSAGIFLLESNLGGWGKVLALGGQIGDRKRSVFAAYRDPSVAGSRFTAGASVGWADDRAERYTGDTLAYAYRDERLSVRGDAGLRLTDRLTAGIGWFGLSVDTGASGTFAAPGRVADAWGLSTSIDYRGADFRLFYESGLNLHAQYEQALPGVFGGRERKAGELRASFGQGNRLGHAWSLGVKGVWVDGDPVVDAIRLGGYPGSRGFSTGGLWAEQAATASLEYQVPLWRPRWGIVSTVALLDAGVVHGGGETTRYLAPGVGMRLHLAGIAIPALGIDVAESSPVREPTVSVSMGFQF